MKISSLIIGLLLPAFSVAQESQPTSMEATSQPATESALPTPPPLQTYNKNGETAYKISLYSTVTGVVGTFAFNSLGVFALRKFPDTGLGAITVSRTMFGVAGLFGTLTLFGPSLGHFYAGETDRGTKLLIRRAVIPTAMIVTGTVVSFVSFGLISARLATEEPVKAGPIVGFAGGFLLAGAGGITYWAMSGKHILDARSAPAREAARRGLKLAGPGSLLPTPYYDAGTKSLGLGASLTMKF